MKIQNVLCNVLCNGLMLLAVTSLSSCSDNDSSLINNGAVGEQAVATFTATLPTNLISRATDGEDTDTPLSESVYSDGLKATTLYYAVYSVESDNTSALTFTNYGSEGDTGYIDDPVTFSNRTASISLHLVIGKQYKIVFWAQSPDTKIYTFSPADGTITIDNENLLCNDETQDAFFSSLAFTFGQETANKSVTLTRPFAQLNIGASDYAYAKSLGFEMQTSQLTIPYLANVLNLFDGSVSGSVISTVYKFNTIPAKQDGAGAFPAKENGVAVDAEYVAMAYILVANSETQNEIQYNYTNKTGISLEDTNVHKFHNVPLQRNHRTNIYGSVLTASQTWNVVINPVYDNDDFNEKAENVKSENAFWAE